MFASKTVFLEDNVDLLSDAYQALLSDLLLKGGFNYQPSKVLAFRLASFFSILVNPASLRNESP